MSDMSVALLYKGTVTSTGTPPVNICLISFLNCSATVTILVILILNLKGSLSDYTAGAFFMGYGSFQLLSQAYYLRNATNETIRKGQENPPWIKTLALISAIMLPLLISSALGLSGVISNNTLGWFALVGGFIPVTLIGCYGTKKIADIHPRTLVYNMVEDDTFQGKDRILLHEINKAMNDAQSSDGKIQIIAKNLRELFQNDQAYAKLDQGARDVIEAEGGASAQDVVSLYEENNSFQTFIEGFIKKHPSFDNVHTAMVTFKAAHQLRQELRQALRQQ